MDCMSRVDSFQWVHPLILNTLTDVYLAQEVLLDNCAFFAAEPPNKARGRHIERSQQIFQLMNKQMKFMEDQIRRMREIILEPRVF